MMTQKKKGEKLVKLLSFFIVKFILQNCEIGDFHQFNLASVLFLPASEDRTEDSLCKVGAKDRTDLEGEILETFLFCVVGEASLDCLVNYDT